MPIVRVDPAKPSEPSLPPARARVRTRPLTTPDPGVAADAPDAPAEEEADSEVGYRKPPRHSQFRPGQFGNPRGRPKAAKGLQSIVKDTLTQKVAVRTATGTKKITRIEAVLQKTVEQALKGNPRALAELLKLYGQAVPDEKQAAPDDRIEGMTETDLATLEELRKMLAAGKE